MPNQQQPLPNLSQALRQATQRLANSSETPYLDAQLLLGEILGHTATGLVIHDQQALSADEYALFTQYIARRGQGEPVAYILGRCGFWTFDLAVTPDVLIPRPDTETLVEAALNILPPDQPLNIIDLGTGSGAIALALASERPQWHVSASDQSAAALNCARHNAQQLELQRIQFYQGSWLAPVAERTFDAIVANPPYIDPQDSHLKALRYEPITALTAEQQGLADLATIIAQAPRQLNAKGWLMLEHGYDQAVNVAELMQQAGFKQIAHRQDLGGNTRVTLGQFQP